MQDIFASGATPLCFVRFRLYGAESLFILRVGKTWAGLQRVPSIATSSVKPCSVVSDQFVTYAQTVGYLQSCAGWTTGLLDLLLSLDWDLFGSD
jgi:hypothetical protein